MGGLIENSVSKISGLRLFTCFGGVFENSWSNLLNTRYPSLSLCASKLSSFFLLSDGGRPRRKVMQLLAIFACTETKASPSLGVLESGSSIPLAQIEERPKRSFSYKINVLQPFVNFFLEDYSAIFLERIIKINTMVAQIEKFWGYQGEPFSSRFPVQQVDHTRCVYEEVFMSDFIKGMKAMPWSSIWRWFSCLFLWSSTRFPGIKRHCRLPELTLHNLGNFCKEIGRPGAAHCLP